MRRLQRANSKRMRTNYYFESENKPMKNRKCRVVGTMIAVALAAIQSLAQSTYEPYTFTTLAGGGGFVSADVAGNAAQFNLPTGVTVDGAGNVYVSDTFNHVIRKVAPTGEVTTLAGLAGSTGSANGTGSGARFYFPNDVAVDIADNVYVADESNQTIRKVTPAGEVTTLAGLAGSPGSANGTGSNARFNYPAGVAVDSAGNFYMADNDNHTIRMVSPVGTNWVVTTLAGLARHPGSADGTGDAARFFGPFDVAVDRAGNLYVADGDNNMIRKVTPVGT